MSLLTNEELLKMTNEQIIRYILGLTGYNDIIYIIHKTLDEETMA